MPNVIVVPVLLFLSHCPGKYAPEGRTHRQGDCFSWIYFHVSSDSLGLDLYNMQRAFAPDLQQNIKRREAENIVVCVYA